MTFNLGLEVRHEPVPPIFGKRVYQGRQRVSKRAGKEAEAETAFGVDCGGEGFYGFGCFGVDGAGLADTTPLNNNRKRGLTLKR